ncbi:MAG TPA: DUF4932 domain-containing protein [Paludibacter sp.]|nr:DUF4932 domain-containing protein [Paludibacter sp.]
MKKISILLLLLLSTTAFAQDNLLLDKPKVDERVELLSIVFRLADSKEYSSIRYKTYTDKIETHFANYKNHKLIRFVKKIRLLNGVGYDAVMKMAFHIDRAPYFKPLVEFSKTIPEERWGKKNALKFIKLLQQFYVDAQCEEFFKENSEMYQEVSNRFIPIYNHLDVKWYKDFYGKEPKEKFVIINGLGNGNGNYGGDIVFQNGERQVYAIMGTWSVDSLGIAKFNLKDYFPTLLHEFNHSFVNYLTEQNRAELQESGPELFKEVKDKMKKQAYSEWETMISEAMVRAAVIKYMKDHKFAKADIDKETQQQLKRGFFWINDLVEELENYDHHRDTYPTLESYMPNIISAYKKYAEHIGDYTIEKE